MRVINFNIKGARVPERKDCETQERSWHLLAAYGADLALVQEVELTAIQNWAKERWTIVMGEPAFLGDLQVGWGSVIAAHKGLKLRARNDLLDQKWVKLLYDYAVFGQIELPDGDPAIVVSVHAPAQKIQSFLKCVQKPGALTPEEMATIAQPGDDAWAIDLFFAAISSLVECKRFLVGGDWNNSRLFDLDPKLRKRGQPPFATMFFTRARDAGWFECHGSKNEERSYLNPRVLPHQLDHLFCDTKTAKKMTECSIKADWPAPELSDHAPMVTDFRWP
jgi:endonuclease/exonuclease/phosphatase family metal-dependent hydrolase